LQRKNGGNISVTSVGIMLILNYINDYVKFLLF